MADNGNNRKPVQLPSNVQVTESIANIKEDLQKTIPRDELSSTGQQAVKEATSILSTIQTGLQDRNKDDLIQDTIQKIENAVNIMSSKEYVNSMSKIGHEMIVLPGKMALEKLSSFVRVFFVHSNSRKLMAAILDLIEDLIRAKDDTEAMDKLVERFTDIFFDFQSLLVEYVGQLRSLGSRIPDFTETELSALNNEEIKILSQAKDANQDAFNTFKKCFHRIFGASLEPILGSIQELKLDKEDLNSIQRFLDWFEERLKGTIQRNKMQDGRDNQALREFKKESQEQLSLLKYLFLIKFNQERVESLRIEAISLVDNIQNDPLIQSLATQSSHLVDTLIRDSQGRLAIKPELLNDLQLILPGLFKKLARFPLPQIKVEKDDIEFLVKDIQLNIEGLAPRQLSLSFISAEEIKESLSQSNPTKQIDPKEGSGGQLCLFIKGITADIRNFYVWYHRKTIPKFEDSGRADLTIKGMNVSFYLEQFSKRSSAPPSPISPSPLLEGEEGTGAGMEKGGKGKGMKSQQIQESNSQIEVKKKTNIKIVKADCSIDQVYFKMFDTGHDWIYKIISPFIRMILKEKIETETKKALTEIDLHSIF